MRLRLQPTAINQQPLKFLQWEFSIPYNLRNEPGNLAKHDFSFSHTEKEMLSMQYNTPIFFTKTCTCHFSRNSGGRILYSLQIWLFFLLWTNSFFFFFFVIEKFSEWNHVHFQPEEIKSKKNRNPSLATESCVLFYICYVFSKTVISTDLNIFQKQTKHLNSICQMFFLLGR